MKSRKWIFPLALAALVLVVYLWPVPHHDFAEVYAKAPADKAASLQAFRADYPTSTIRVDGLDWEYLSIGKGPQTIVFLHGMTGSYDIWWQQVEALKGDYRVMATPALAAQVQV